MKNLIKQIREHFNISQTQMGRKIGMTETYISAMERGSIYPSDDVISRLSTIFGIRSDWLKTGEEPMFLPGRERPAVDVDGIGERVKKIRKTNS